MYAILKFCNHAEIRFVFPVPPASVSKDTIVTTLIFSDLPQHEVIMNISIISEYGHNNVQK